MAREKGNVIGYVLKNDKDEIFFSTLAIDKKHCWKHAYSFLAFDLFREPVTFEQFKGRALEQKYTVVDVQITGKREHWLSSLTRSLKESEKEQSPVEMFILGAKLELVFDRTSPRNSFTGKTKEGVEVTVTLPKGTLSAALSQRRDVHYD